MQCESFLWRCVLRLLWKTKHGLPTRICLRSSVPLATGNGGAVNMKISINTAPPEWAYSYQIVYGGNNNYNKFIQYTAGGAFVVDIKRK